MIALKRFASAILLAVAGCQSMTGAADVPALIVEPTDASRAALGEAVNTALRTTVLLAPDALTGSSALTVERNVPGGIGAPPAQGRNMDRPILFRLVKSGDACILVDSRDDTRYELANTACVAETASSN